MPKPEHRQRVRAFAESQWREPVVVVHLGEVAPEFDVPGRRKDGTVQGTRLVRRFFRNLVFGAIGVPINAVLSVLGGGAANLFARNGTVTGPPNAQALGLVDAATPASNPWLVSSRSQIAVLDTPSSSTRRTARHRWSCGTSHRHRPRTTIPTSRFSPGPTDPSSGITSAWRRETCSSTSGTSSIQPLVSKPACHVA